MKTIRFLLVGILLAVCGSARAQNPELTLRQLNHRVFTATDGAPGDIDALAQTPDGTLWIGGRTGLTRFDGVRFMPYPAPGEEPLHSTNISTLFAAQDGSLWIGFRPRGVSVLKRGRVTRYSQRNGLPDGPVEQFAVDRDGSMWAAARLGLARLRGQRWEQISDETGIPYGVLVDRTGTVWLATVEGLLARPAGEDYFRAIDNRIYNGTGVLAAAPDGSIWAAARHELIRVDPSRNPQPDDLVAVRGISGGPLLVDSEGNLWAAEFRSHVLLRVSSPDLNRADQQDAIVHPQRLLLEQDQSYAPVRALLEDRERNVWIATSIALHRISRSNVVRQAVPQCVRGSMDIGAAFAAGDAGALWIACEDGSGTYVDEIRDGAVVRRQNAPYFTVAYRDTEGTVWFGGPTALGRLERGRIVTTPLPPHLVGRPIQALVRGNDGAIWISQSRRGVFRFLDGGWSAYGGVDSLPRDFAIVATTDGTGTLWFGYTDNRIARLSRGIVQLYSTAQGVEVGNVLSTLVQDGQIWVGGELGLARLDGTRFVSIRDASGTPFRGISGIVRTRNGDLWVNGIGGIARIAAEEIGRILHDPAHHVRSEMFNYLDGVPGTALGLRPQPSAIETTDGRVWFSMTGGIVSIDPTRLLRNSVPPPVTIWSLTSGSVHYPNQGAHLRLPVHSTDLEIDYSAGSLTIPERVRFRYKLEGLDRDWHDVGTRREAHYTNLGPGRYTFRVTASNNDGVWNRSGAAMTFTILPAFYQTGWFYALCGLACAAILLALYRARMRQVAAQTRGRLEARVAERERIARDLHDTLLQGMQGLIWRFQAAADRIPASEPARELMEQSLDRADQLLAEGRDRVKDLHPAPGDVADLAQALTAEGEQFAREHPAEFRVSVQGVGRELHPIVREEGFLIGREALGNAFRHALARTIEAEVSYGDAALHVRVRDDGQGIGSAVLAAGGKPGHLGLIGMRERAKKLGAHLEVWSKPGAGTEVDLRVPAQVAYRRTRNDSRGSRSWRAIFRSAAPEP